MADASLSFNILTKYQDRGVKQASKDFDRLGTKTVAVGSLIGQAMFSAAKSVVSFAKDGIGGVIAEAREAGKVTRITENVIRATGGAAKISAAQVSTLAESLSNKTAIDDEAIQSGANLLLTFKNVRNEVGRGNDIFNRATAAAVDLSAAGFGSLDSASKMLGKALNDPLKGLTALGRAGVTFTDQQKKQIKTLVESGHVLDAQRIIMKEVESQVGGAAKAAADPMQRLGVIVANLKERLGTALLPIINKASDWLGQVLPKALDKTMLGFRALGAAFREGDVTSDGFVGAMERIGVTVRKVFDFIKTSVVPPLKSMAGFVARNTEFFGPFVVAIGGIVLALKAWRAVQTVVNVLLTVNPIGLVVVALAALVAGLTVAYKRSETFRGIVQRAFQVVGDVVSRFGGFITGTVVPAVVKFAGILGRNLAPAVRALGDWVRERLLPALRGLWDRVQENMPAFRSLAKFIGGVIAVIAVLVSWLIGKLYPIFLKIAGPVLTLLFAALGKLIGIIGGTIRAVGAVVRAFTAGWAMIRTVVLAGVRFVTRVFLDMVGTVLSGAARAFGWVPGIGGKLKTAAAEFNKFKDRVNRALDGISDESVGVKLNASMSRTAIDILRANRVSLAAEHTRRAAGGILPGPPSDRDNMLIRAASGEFVVNARATQKNRPLLEAINSGAPGFAGGGVIPRVSDNANPAVGAFARYMGAATHSLARTAGAVLSRSMKEFFGGLGAGGNAGYRGGSGVERWRGVALQALALAGSPSSWIGSLLRRMNQESGGNPRAINLWDSNARAGTPSIGLMQTIGPTFNAYAGSLRSRGIYDPLANIYASIRYANARYGSAPRGWDRAGGYALGGTINEPIFGVGRSGRTYTFGERGPETVIPGRARAGARGGDDARGGDSARQWAREFVRELRNQGLVLMPVDAGRRADLLARAG